MNHSYMDIGQRVKTYRLNRGLSQDELAEGICSRQTISLLENGQHLPSAEFMKKIAVKLGISFHEIMVDQVNNLEAKVQLDIIKVYVETADYANALPLIEECEDREDLLEFQRRELVLLKAECLTRTGKSAEAIKLLTDLQQRLELERDADDHFMAILYDRLGTASYFLSNIANAHAYYMRAYQLTLRFPMLDLTAARISYNLGMVCRQLNRQIDSIEYLRKAESFFKVISDSKRLAQVLFELGIAYRFGGDLVRADKYLQESLVLYKQLNFVNMAYMVRESYAFTVMSRHQPEQAIEELLECIKEFEKDGNLLLVSFTYARIAYIRLKQRDIKGAEFFLQKSTDLFTKEEAFGNPRLAYVLRVKSMHYLEINNFVKCIEFSNLSSEIFDTIGLVTEAAESLKLSAEAYRRQREYKEADAVSQKIIDFLVRSKDSISKVEAYF
ncbi:helix-turn-helix domain-containing protein [Tumebacillus lipolyticus]|uniref:Helix-turn-helix domain-containing protein n=1 Tax=Tumebacillus lipolyticus TaxID=1280370 RepID=A0ABW4ZW87_9BACL